MKASKEEGDFRKGRYFLSGVSLNSRKLISSGLTTVLLNKLNLLAVYRESFALVKGAVLLVEEAERVGFREEIPQTVTSPSKHGCRASDTQRRHLHAMVEHLRPEDTIKLVRILLY